MSELAELLESYTDEQIAEALEHRAMNKQGWSLFQNIDVLDFGVRWRSVRHAFHAEGMHYVGDIAQMTEQELLREPNLGKLSVARIKASIEARGLQLGMVVSWWPKTLQERSIIASRYSLTNSRSRSKELARISLQN